MKSVVLFALALLLLSFSCNTTDPPPPPQYVRTIELSAEDASCTEAWLRVRITDGSQPPFDVRLTRNDQTLQTHRLSTPDSLLIDEGLLPNQQYTYKAYRLTDSRLTDSSTQISVTTMDTTSHNWVFDPPVLLGDGGSSVLYDVTIINDTLVYAVGEIYKRDSLGNWDPQPYNLARWDGSSWNVQKVPYYHQGQPFYSPIRAVFAFNANDIWFGIGNLIHWNGQGFISVALPSGVWGPYRVNKIWGHDGEIWIVGDGGSIAHRSVSGTWRRLESGTDVTLLDVWGSPDGSVVWACGFEDFKPTVLLRYAGNAWEKVYEDTDHRFMVRYDSLSGVLVSGYAASSKTFFVLSPSGLYRLRDGLAPAAQRYSFASTFFPGFPFRLAGGGMNNLVVAGEFAMLAHFNGVTWRYYNFLYDPNRRLRSVALRGNELVAVGVQYGGLQTQACVIRGTKSHGRRCVGKTRRLNVQQRSLNTERPMVPDKSTKQGSLHLAYRPGTGCLLPRSVRRLCPRCLALSLTLAPFFHIFLPVFLLPCGRKEANQHPFSALL